MAKRRGKKLVVLLVIFGVLIAAAVVADRVAAATAESRVGDVVAERASAHELSSSQDPDVSITGFPFLTQLIAGEYKQIDIELSDLEYEELVMPKLDIRAEDVSAKFSDVTSGEGPIVAAEMSADGHVEYSALTDPMEAATSASVTSDGGGELSISADADMAGQQIPVVGKASVQLSEGSLEVTAYDFVADGVDLPEGGQSALGSLAGSMSRSIGLPELPYGLTVDDVHFESETMVLTASASDVPLA